MKVLMINASPRPEGNTSRALAEMEKIFAEENIEVEVVQVGNKDIRGCIACGTCYERGKCVFDDVVNELAAKLDEADGMVVGSPVYYASPNGTLISLMDRLFYSSGGVNKTMKVGAAVAVARRGGITASYDVMNKYFGISGMPVASGQYWNGAHGRLPGEASEDAEGMQQMRTLARNMVFLMKSIALGREQYGIPEREPGVMTNFVR